MSDIQTAAPSAAERRAALLQRWRQSQTAQPTSSITRSSAEGDFPLAFAQERLWFLQQMLPDSPGYYLPIALRLRGTLDTQALARSFAELIRRHAILRSTFPAVSGKPIQRISSTAEFTLERVDLRTVDAREREAEAQRRAISAYQQPFDLVNGPLFRAILFQLDDQEQILLITLHHLISDGWSNGLLLRELGNCYNALSRGQAPTLPELAYQYVDLVNWDRQRFESGALAASLAYWQKQLGGKLPVLQLPSDLPRPAVPSGSGATHSFRLPTSSLAALRQLCQQEHVTLVMALLAVFQTMLYRYTGQEDLSVGIPVFNRHRSETEGLIGLFVNTLVIRSALTSDISFRELLGRVRATTLAAYEHQEYPFEKLVEALHPDRDTSHTPLFQVMLSIGAGAEEQQAWHGLEVQPYNVDRPGANFDLTLEVTEQPDGLYGTFVYRTDLFLPATIERMVGHFINLLNAGVAQPEQPIGQLPILAAAERRQIVEAWNATSVIYPQVHCLHQLIEEQVERSPEAIAVSYTSQRLNYRDLNARANQLAHCLRAQGVGPGTLVGIAAERSLELVVGLLGILKAGAAYVPLDPSYPRERLAMMLEDAQVPVLLTQEHLLATLPPTSARLLCLDRDWPQIATYRSSNPLGGRDPDQLAYMIYTSGSTGRPKGALNSHRGICNRLLWMQQHYQLTPSDRVLQKTPFSFDVSVWEFFWPLIIGARLVMARPEGHKDPAYLVETIISEQISTIHFVPSMLQLFLEEPDVPRCTSLQRVICSGEALSYELQSRFFARSQAALSNLYGPTEAAVDVTWWTCERNSAERIVPIGRPVANTQIYILDPQGQPVPIGVAGELHIGGVQVGRGYYQRPEITAARFIPDPFAPTLGPDGAPMRLYKTGDLARYRPDGSIEYLGRLDFQVKLRGLRIELGEIEAVLGQHPALREVVVQAHAVAAGDTRLVAYVVPHADAERSELIAELRAFLSTRLPDYMVPGHMMLLEALPLNPSGKVDRKALPAPELDANRNERTFVAPRNDTERTIAEIWQEVLRIPNVGTQDNFFELGGHSLLVTQVRARIQERLGVDLSIIDAFRLTTVEALAQHISQGRNTQTVATQTILSRAEMQRQALQRRRGERR